MGPGNGLSLSHNTIDQSPKEQRLFAVFGGLALLFAAMGLFSVFSYDVAQRRHQKGVRIALGVQTSDVLRLVVERAVLLTGIALLLRGVIAMWSGRFVEPLLFHVSARDPGTYVAVIVTLLVAAIGASAWPAFRHRGSIRMRRCGQIECKIG